MFFYLKSVFISIWWVFSADLPDRQEKGTRLTCQAPQERFMNVSLQIFSFYVSAEFIVGSLIITVIEAYAPDIVLISRNV